MTSNRAALAGLVGAAAVLATACGATAPTADVTSAKAFALPPTSGVFDYQLGGNYDRVTIDGTEQEIDVVVRDATADPLPGAYNVCYVNGFQTQPSDADFWRDEHPELLLTDPTGEPVIDPDWPDEFVLDPSTTKQRDGIVAIIGPQLTGCADSGFDAVEIDNLDSWTRFEQIDEAGAHELARAYVGLAHDAGMAIAQKNAAEITETAKNDLGFDFAVSEECGAWDECAAYTDVYGDHVLQIEYPESLAEADRTFEQVCAEPARAPLTILRDVELVAAGKPGYLYEVC